MTRTRRLATVVLAVVVGLTACSDATSVATVDGVPIDLTDVTALRHSFADEVTLDSEAFRQDLTPLIFLQAQLNAAEEEFGLTDLDSDERVDAKLANPTPEDQAIFDQVLTNADRTEAVLRVIAAQLIVREEVTRELIEGDDEFLSDIFENDMKSISTVCVRHILTATEEEAAVAKARVEAGEDFSTVADEVTIDTTAAGGSLPCPAQAGIYVEPFGSTVATAPIGELTGPIQTEFGWHILVVDERTAPATVEELTADPLAYLDPSLVGERWGAWLDGAVAAADIVVSSEVGRWFAEGDGILPPS